MAKFPLKTTIRFEIKSDIKNGRILLSPRKWYIYLLAFFEVIKIAWKKLKNA